MKQMIPIASLLVLTVIFFACKPYHEKKLPKPSAYQAHFPDMDTNGDERVNWAEFKQHFPDTKPHVFEALDMNKDRAVDHDEWHEFKKAHGLKEH